MNYTFKLSAIAASAVLTLAGCGPESNSRYGDEFWDPQSTWEAAQVVSQPDLTVVYNDTDPADDAEDWEAYVSIDFSDLLLRNEGGSNFGLLQYSVGSSEKLAVDPFLQNGKTFSESDFIYDETNSTDYRLLITDPENYSFYLDLSVRQPNGTLRVYNFEWNDIVVPGPLTRDDFWANRMNGIVVPTCTSCHNEDGSDAHTAFDLDTNNVTTTRTDFVAEVLEADDGQNLPDWPFDSNHTGVGNANLLTADEVTDFNTFIQGVIDQGDTNDFTLTDIAEPATMTDDPYN